MPSGKTSSPAVCYAPRPDATEETERFALAAVYAFVLSATKNAADAGHTSGGDVTKRSKRPRQ